AVLDQVHDRLQERALDGAGAQRERLGAALEPCHVSRARAGDRQHPRRRIHADDGAAVALRQRGGEAASTTADVQYPASGEVALANEQREGIAEQLGTQLVVAPRYRVEV